MLEAQKQQIIQILEQKGDVCLAILFGSMASGEFSAESDLDLAVLYAQKIDSETKMYLIEQLALLSGRPIDLIDLVTVGEPLLGQILYTGERLKGSDGEYGKLLSRHLIDQADFMPYRKRILDERRAAWIGN